MQIPKYRRGLGLLLGLLLQNLSLSQGSEIHYEALHSQWLQSLPSVVQLRMEDLARAGIKFERTQFVLASQGIGGKELSALRTLGIDIGGLDIPRDYLHQAVWHEVILRGRVVTVDYDTSATACLRTRAVVEVTELFKTTLRHEIPPTIIIVNQGNTRIRVSHEFRPVEGAEYLFFLSNARLTYWISQTARCTERVDSLTFVPGGKSPQLVGDEAWVPDGGQRLKVDSLLDDLKPVLGFFELRQ